MLRAIYAFHRYAHGWNDIGYNFVIDLYGRIFEARAGGIDEPVVGAHAGGYNLVSTGVAVLGSFSSTSPISPAARSALERCWRGSSPARRAARRAGWRCRVNPAGAHYSRFPANAQCRCRASPATATAIPPNARATCSTASCPASAGASGCSRLRRARIARQTLGQASATAAAPQCPPTPNPAETRRRLHETPGLAADAAGAEHAHGHGPYPRRAGRGRGGPSCRRARSPQGRARHRADARRSADRTPRAWSSLVR